MNFKRKIDLKFSFFLLSLSNLVILSACANGPCRHLRNPSLAEGQAKAVTSDTAQGASPAAGAAAIPTIAMPAPSMMVYKPDGSLQCGSVKGQSLEEMQKQLHGITILSRDKRPDGRMHIQICGSPTGLINVFEIPLANSKDAEIRGFKKL